MNTGNKTQNRWVLAVAILFAVLLATSCGEDVTVQKAPPASPASVSGFTALRGLTKVGLAWITGGTDFTGVMIRRDTAGYPADETLGTLVYDGALTTFVDTTGIVDGTLYYYAAFPYDSATTYYTGGQASATPADNMQTRGYATYWGGMDSDFGFDVTLDSAGRVLATGRRKPGTFDMAVLRFDTLGDPDAAFGTGGIFLHHNAGGGNAYDEGSAIVVQPDGKIVVAGQTSAASRDMAVWRVNTDGTLDTTFGGDRNTDGTPDGFFVHHAAAGGNGDEGGPGVALQADGKIVVAGFSNNGTNNDMVVWRLTAAGALDTTFGGDIDGDFTPDGFFVHDSAAGGSNNDVGKAVVVLGDGKILVTGLSNNAAPDADAVVWKLNADGSLDTTFGGDLDGDFTPDGFAVHNNTAGGNANDFAFDMVVQADGKIVVAGDSVNGAGNRDMVVWRLNADGSLDNTFGGDLNTDSIPDGFFVHDGAAGGSANDFGIGVALDGSGRIVVSGSSSNGADNDMAVWRLTTTGALDTTFGGDVNPVDDIPDGFFTHNNAAGGNATDNGKKITILPSGELVIVGNSFNTKAEITLWHLTPDGALSGW